LYDAPEQPANRSKANKIMVNFFIQSLSFVCLIYEKSQR
jgi:hypothetical protein